jgi:hypothetical protein
MLIVTGATGRRTQAGSVRGRRSSDDGARPLGAAGAAALLHARALRGDGVRGGRRRETQPPGRMVCSQLICRLLRGDGHVTVSANDHWHMNTLQNKIHFKYMVR